MSCQACSPPGKRNFLLVLIDSKTSRVGRCIVQCKCAHDAAECVEEVAARGELIVHDPSRDNEPFLMLNPRVVVIDAKTASHLPLLDVDPV